MRYLNNETYFNSLAQEVFSNHLTFVLNCRYYIMRCESDKDEWRTIAFATWSHPSVYYTREIKNINPYIHSSNSATFLYTNFKLKILLLYTKDCGAVEHSLHIFKSNLSVYQLVMRTVVALRHNTHKRCKFNSDQWLHAIQVS